LSTTEGLHVPVILFVDVAGNIGTVPPAHITRLAPKLNVGGMLGLTVTVNVVVVAHNPAAGVNVYTPEFWLLATDGFHVPDIPLVDVVGNDGTVPFAHIARLVPKLKTGVTIGLTVTLKVVGVAHCPAAGVNVYDPEFWLSTIEGLHVPVILFVDDVGKAGTLAPAQIVKLVPKLNVGVIFGFTVTVKFVGLAHKPAVGVNVYTPEFRLLTVEGLHVPVTPLVDVVGKAGTVPPEQIVKLVPKLKAGVVLGITVIFMLVGTVHCPGAGVNV